MSGIGWTELFIIGLILLIFVGPRRLPELFGRMAWVIAQIRAAGRDLRNQIDSELTDIRQVKSEITSEMIARTDKLYAEARQMDDEYKALQDDVGDVKSELEDNLKDVGETMKAAERHTAAENSANHGNAGGADARTDRELKG